MAKKIITDKASPLFDDAEYSMTCKGKKVYSTPYQAQYEIDIIKSRNSGVSLSYYKCPYCQNYHLTSR